MEEVSLTETESRYFGDLFLCCDVEKTGKIPMLKATELYRSANLTNDVIHEITSLANIPDTALHISRAQFYSCLKLIAAHQAAMPLRQELIAATVQLPLPRFSWKDSPSAAEAAMASAATSSFHQSNGLTAIPPPPATDRKNSLPRRGDWQEATAATASLTGSRRNSSVQQQHQLEAAVNSDVMSTDSEVEQNESSCGGGGGSGAVGASSSGRTHRRGRGGSPEAWSTNSDSPTPTNSVAERPWAKENLWHGLLGDEHRRLLGTEEESSDRHSSDDDNDTDLETVYQITPEQREYYYKQFKAVQHDANGLLSGQVARVFFEKSRIPVEELRHIWQLCDVTRDGALSLAEFTAAMHLVVLRRNNIPLPAVLPACLYPSVLQHATALAPQEPPEADLLHLNDDDEEDNTDNTIVGGNSSVVTATSARVPPSEKNVMNLSTISTSSQVSTNSRQGNNAAAAAANHTSMTPPALPPPVKNRSISNSPNNEPNTTPPNLPTAAIAKPKDRNLWAADPPTQWTKFSESPTSNVSSPGPKPVNFDMQRTAQAVVSDPQILHPVPLRVTPVAGAVTTTTTADMLNQDPYEGVILRESSPKQQQQQQQTTTAVAAGTTTGVPNNRDSIQNTDLRAIQRPQAKKLPAKNIGALPPPPQRESSIGSVGSGSNAGGAGGDGEYMPANGNQQAMVVVGGKKDPPPLPPPRPHRHGRSSSLDLNKFKMNAPATQQPEITAQASFDLQSSTGFADFTHFPDDGATTTIANVNDLNTEQQQHSLPPAQSLQQQPPPAALPPSRFSLQSNQRVSAFEVYRKPNTPRSSQSPPQPLASAAVAAAVIASTQPTQPPPPAPVPFGAIGAAAIGAQQLPNADLYEKRVNAISETLRHVSFKHDNNNSMPEVLRHLREQNNLLLRLCNDLSDELLTVQTRKEEMRLKLEAAVNLLNTEVQSVSFGRRGSGGVAQTARAGSSISAPVTANITGGSGSSGVHSNV